MEKEFNPQESLQLIQGMINKAQNRFAENGFLYLLWGWVVFFLALLQFCLIKFTNVQKPEMVWIATWLVVIYQIFYIAKKAKTEKVKTYTDELIGYVWMVFGITMFITGFVLGKNNEWQSLYALIIGLYGMPTFLSGSVLQFPALKIGAVCCWILSIVASFIANEYMLIILALAVVTAWIIPGYLLKAKYQKENLSN